MSIKTDGWPIHTEDEIEAVKKVLTSGCTNYWTGTECVQFETEYANFIGTKYAVALMNGTVALEAALYALDIGPGDEVITSCRTFIATASSIVMRGAKPVLVDIDMNSQNITAETIEPFITSRTKAIIVVHLAGWPAEMEAILALANNYNLKVLEDCAQAHGASVKHRYVGTWGDIAAFSFCQDKIMTTGGEGGMVTTNDCTLWQKVWAFKEHGKNYDKVHQKFPPHSFHFVHDTFGTNLRMTEMQAAIGRVQLPKLTEWIRIRNKNAAILNKKFKDVPALRVTIPSGELAHAYYKYYVFIRPEKLRATWDRNRIIQEINIKGVPCFPGICSEIYLEQAFQQIADNITQSKPTAKLLGETSLMFLVHPTLSEQEIENSADALVHVMKAAT